jgi:hypothetical protein
VRQRCSDSSGRSWAHLIVSFTSVLLIGFTLRHFLIR